MKHFEQTTKARLATKELGGLIMQKELPLQTVGNIQRRRMRAMRQWIYTAPTGSVCMWMMPKRIITGRSRNLRTPHNLYLRPRRSKGTNRHMSGRPLLHHWHIQIRAYSRLMMFHRSCGMLFPPKTNTQSVATVPRLQLLLPEEALLGHK
jgi:hypothetical protein